MFDKPDPMTRLMPYVEATKASLRWFWTSRPALSLPLHHRRAAAADPALEWDPDSRSYRRKRRASPAPPTATEGEGGQNVYGPTPARPAAATKKSANLISQPGCASGARPRAHAREGDEA